MGSRDEYMVSLRCLCCGKEGVAHLSEYDPPSIYSGNGRTLDALTDGFTRGPGTRPDGSPTTLCVDSGFLIGGPHFLNFKLGYSPFSSTC
jgi:hypothetical protein